MAPDHNATSDERGQALLLAVLAIGITLGVTAALNQIAHRANQRVASTRDGVQLRAAAELGLAQAKLVVWDSFLRAGGGDLTQYRDWLTTDADLPDGRTRWVSRAGTLVGAAPTNGALTVGQGLGSERVQVTLSVARADDASSTYVTLVAEARDGRGRSLRQEQVLRSGAPQWSGFRYALLGKNLNCVMCHTRIDNATRAFGAAGPHARVKAASLDGLRIDADASSVLAGTLYTRGPLLDAGGAPVAAPPGGPLGIRSLTLDAGDGTIVGAPVVDMVDGMPGKVPFSNFYKDYPTDPAQQFDGALPADFPPVIPDADADRQVDDGEWTARASGTSGEVRGGVILGLPAAAKLPGASLPVVGNLGVLPSNMSDRNVVLVGTALRPLEISGTVAIDGDLVISGVVRGTGQLLVRGNIYIIGDLTYADGTDGSGKRTFGRAADGSPNVVAYTAGGSIVHGAYNLDYRDPLIPVGPGIPTPVTDANLQGFTGQQLGLFNRMEWTKTQPFYDPATKTLTTTDTGVPNAAYVPGYVARYYSLDDKKKPQMFLHPGNTWDNTNQVWLGPERGDPNVKLDPKGHVVKGLNSNGDWVPPLVLGALNVANDLARPRGAYRIDGLLYSDGAVLLNSDRATQGDGQVVVNGAVIASDVAAAVPGPGGGGVGLRINYDDRVRKFVQVADPSAAKVAVYSVYRLER